MARSLIVIVSLLLISVFPVSALAAELDPALENADSRVAELVQAVQATYNYQITGKADLKEYELTSAVFNNYVQVLESLLTVSDLEGQPDKNVELLEQLAGAIEDLASL